MKPVRTSLVAAALLASLASGVMAQATPAPQDPATSGHHHRHGRMDPAKRQEMFNRRMGELKQKLQLTAAQEPAWNSFVQAMQPPAAPRPRLDRQALANMATPERIDRMTALRTQRNAEMDQRAQATKTFYAQLSAEQKKTFDAQLAARMRPHGEHRGR